MTILSTLIVGGTFHSTVMAAPKFCWKDSQTRGAGTIPGQPPKGQFRHLFSDIWYSCPNGYIRSLNPDINAPDACVRPSGKALEYSKANKAGKVFKAMPASSFFDPLKGGEYWSCPKNYKRSLAPVSANDACTQWVGERTKRAQFLKNKKISRPSGAFEDPRRGGEYWSCRAGYKRSLAAVTAGNACTQWVGERLKKATFLKNKKNSKPSGAFEDPNGNYYSCPGGYKRTWSPVTASDACIKGGWWGKKTRATNHGKIWASQPRGSFGHGSQYWTCNGWDRTAYGIKSSKACSTPGYYNKSVASYRGKIWASQPSGSFGHGSQYWTCNGWNRSANPINSAAACSTAGYYKKKNATFRSKVENPQPKGAFKDITYNKNFWACPKDTVRTVFSVNGNKACSKDFKPAYAKREGSVCGRKQEQAGLCYNKCPTGYDPVGPVCWIKRAPAKNWVHCGGGFAKDKKTCTFIVGAQVGAAIEVAAFIFSAGTSATASTGAKALKAHKQMVKMSKAKRWATLNRKKAAVLKGFNQAKAAGQNVAAYGSSLSNLSAATTEEDLVRAAADIASLADPTGISSAAAAYTYPKCSKYASLGAFKGDKKTIKSSASSVMTGKVTIGSPNSEAECKAVANSAKLKLGGKGYAFSSNFSTKGCYYYKTGKYKKIAYWGGTGKTMNSSNVKGAGGKTRMFIDTEKLCRAWAASKKINGKTLKWGGSGKYSTKGCYYYTSSKYKGKAYFGK